MKTYTHKAALNSKNKYSTFEIPESVSTTRSPKNTEACINFSLVISDDSSEAGHAFFRSIDDAKKTYDLNINRENVKNIELLIKKEGKWYLADGETQKWPKS